MSYREEEKNKVKTKWRGQASFLCHSIKLKFTQLTQSLTHIPILYYFNPGYHIRIEKDISAYEISGVLNQLTLN